MTHSDPLEQHTMAKLEKIRTFVDDSLQPFHLDVWLKANKTHPHHAVEIHLKTHSYNLHTHEEGVDMYLAIDQAIDKIVGLLIKEKEKKIDKYHKITTEKQKF